MAKPRLSDATDFGPVAISNGAWRHNLTEGKDHGPGQTLHKGEAKWENSLTGQPV